MVKLVCKPNLFAIDQEIILIDTNAELGYQVQSLAKCDFSSLGQFLAVGSLTHQADEIEMSCPEVVSKKIVEDFWRESEILHANKNIKITIRNKDYE